MKRGASVNHIEFIEQYKSQVQIQDIVGISPRYLRLIKEGKRSGAKYEDALRSLYDLLRKSTRPPKKRKRPPRKAPILSYVYVPDVMNVLFQIFEPRTWKIPKRKYQHRQSRFLLESPTWPTGEQYDTWDSFFITLGVIPEGDKKLQRYKRVMVREEEEEEEEKSELLEADSIERFMEIIDSLSFREKETISHLPLVRWMKKIVDEGIPYEDSLFVNFWVSRVSTPLMPPEDAGGLMESIALDSIEIANNQSDDIEYFLLGVYGYSGWNL